MIHELSHSQLAEISTDILGAAVRNVSSVHGGGNNSIYKIESASAAYALKFYPSQSEDLRDRLGHEYGALEFLNANGIECIPTPIGCRRDQGCALYEWVDGKRIDEVGISDVDALVDFLEQLQSLRNANGVDKISPASASCFCPADVVGQLLDRLVRIEHEAVKSKALGAFLSNYIRPSAETVMDGVKERCRAEGIDFNTPMPWASRALSPSDFGFHNALKDKAGRIVFIDFEYFGWDDPAKMISDLMWHPGMNLPDGMAGYFRDRMSSYFGPQDPELSLRLNLLSPLFGLIWCLILLNEFLPERWARREAAGHVDAETSRNRQLQKASTLYQRLNV